MIAHDRLLVRLDTGGADAELELWAAERRVELLVRLLERPLELRVEAPGALEPAHARREARVSALDRNLLREPHPYPGRLITVEGIDGSGKSTQLLLLDRWLMARGYRVHFTEWNSSRLVRRSMKRGKKKDLLTPTTFSLLHAVDFADRLTYQIMPPLKAGMIVLADRYVYTAFARDVARGVHPDWVRAVYSFAPRPDLALYFRVPIEVSLAAPAHRAHQAQVPRGRHGRRAGHRSGRELPPLPEPRARHLRPAGAASSASSVVDADRRHSVAAEARAADGAGGAAGLSRASGREGHGWLPALSAARPGTGTGCPT